MAGPAVGARVAPGAVRALACPSCGAPVALRAMDWTQTVACASCAAVLDARDPNLRVLLHAARQRGPEPLIPLGTRGEWRGAPYEVVGFQERTITADGERFAWREYVLFNPYRGFRYLTEYDGHWNDVVGLQAAPEETTDAGRRAVRFAGTTYRHFQTARAETTWVLGEFPWEARRGDVVAAEDFVAPPFVLSAERDGNEATWSRGEYVPGDAVWRAFGLPGEAPPARGVYANQPSPHADRGSLWPLYWPFAALLLALGAGRCATARDAVAFAGEYVYTPGAVPADGDDEGPSGRAAGGTSAFVTPGFELPPPRFGSAGNVVIETSAELVNNWMAVEYALVDEATGQAYEVARDVERYSGTDPEDGSAWTEGSGQDRARIGRVPPGRYFLRVEPSGGDAATALHPVPWTVRVRRDVPVVWPALLGLLVLALPPMAYAGRGAGFEARRWAESDYGAPNGPAPAAADDDEA